MTSTWALIVVLKIRSNTAFEGLILLISDDVKELMNVKTLDKSYFLGQFLQALDSKCLYVLRTISTAAGGLNFAIQRPSFYIPFLLLIGLKPPPIKTLKWFKDGQLLSEEPRSPKVQIFDTMLRVNNVQTEDGGVYQCFITLDSGLEIQSSGELRLGGEKQTTLFSIIVPYLPFFALRGLGSIAKKRGTKFLT